MTEVDLLCPDCGHSRVLHESAGLSGTALCTVCNRYCDLHPKADWARQCKKCAHSLLSHATVMETQACIQYKCNECPCTDCWLLKTTGEQVDHLFDDEIKHDPVNHPSHYTSHPSGVECIQITEHYNFCLGNAIKYIWRAGLKDSTSTIEDLEKAVWYINREIARLKRESKS